jgi:hypothetical protein
MLLLPPSPSVPPPSRGREGTAFLHRARCYCCHPLPRSLPHQGGGKVLRYCVARFAHTATLSLGPSPIKGEGRRCVFASCGLRVRLRAMWLDFIGDCTKLGIMSVSSGIFCVARFAHTATLSLGPSPIKGEGRRCVFASRAALLLPPSPSVPPPSRGREGAALLQRAYCLHSCVLKIRVTFTGVMTHAFGCAAAESEKLI